MEEKNLNLIEKRLKHLELAKEALLEIMQQMFEGAEKKVYLMDIYAAASIQRTLVIIDGFCGQIRSKNFFCAAPLVRIHLDTLLQFYACFLVKDTNKFVSKKTKGNQTNNLYDKDNNRMTDGYLAEKLSKEGHEWIKRVYEEASKFIHFSEKHILSSFSEMKAGQFSMKIGSNVEMPETAQIEAIDAMIEITELILKYLCGWVYTKNNPPNKTAYSGEN